MFFSLSKIIWFFIQPSAFLICLTLLGCVLLGRGKGLWGGRLCLIGSVGLLLIAFSPVGRLLITPLEDRFPASQLKRAPTGIIVLGGTIEMEVSDARGKPQIVSGGERIIEAVRMAITYPNAKILLAGGANTVLSQPTADAQFVKELMVGMGDKAGRITVEAVSRNTHENAVLAKKVAQPAQGETWVLITSSYHMSRAMGCFRQAGFQVLPHPVDYLSGGKSMLFQPFYYALDGITITDLAVKEWVGLLAYRLTGRTDALFPAPS